MNSNSVAYRAIRWALRTLVVWVIPVGVAVLAFAWLAGELLAAYG